MSDKRKITILDRAVGPDHMHVQFIVDRRDCGTLIFTYEEWKAFGLGLFRGLCEVEHLDKQIEVVRPNALTADTKHREEVQRARQTTTKPGG